MKRISSLSTPAVPVGSAQNLGDAVRKLSEATEAILKSGMNQKSIVILICHETKLPQKTVKAVLDQLPRMKKTFGV